MAKSPAVLDLSYKFTSRKLSKEGEVISTTVGEALTFLDGMTPEEIICRYALREMALAKNSARVKTGAPASRIYQNTNLPPEVASMLATVKAAVAAAVPTMAPKAPSAPKAAPVPALDLSDPLEVAVSQELAQPAPVAPVAPKARPVVEVIMPMMSGKDSKVNDKMNTAMLKARKAAQAPVPVVTPEVVATIAPVAQPAPVKVHKLANGQTTSLDMEALRAAQAARVAARKAAKV